MTNFRFKRPTASYKNAKGDKTTISNATMTDEKALNFLKTNPERISLFSEYPSNWKKLIEGEIETEEQKEARIAAEAEKIEAKKGKEKDKKKTEKKAEKVVAEKTAEKVVEGASEKTETKTEEQKEENKNSEADRVELMKMSLSDLRKKYPEVKATSISAFVDKVLAL